jgi:hypothetical protein
MHEVTMGSAPNPRAETFDIRDSASLMAMAQDAAPASERAPVPHFDACPTWLELSVRYLSDAKVARDTRIAAWRDSDERSKAGALEWEFEASLQAMMASANAVDALYAAVQTKVPLPQSLIDEWRESHAPRYVRISDVLSMAFALERKHADSLRQALAEIFRFRDLAIDPSAKMDAEILHPELGVGVEWRFAYFRCENALLIVRATVRLIAELVASDYHKAADLRKYAEALRPRVDPLHRAIALKAESTASEPSAQ